MAKQKEKELALNLRKNGASIKVIAKKLSVSSSTVSTWCRDVILSDKAIAEIAAGAKEKSVRGLMRYSEEVRQRRIINTAQSMEKGAQKLGKLSARDVYCIGLGLYWGEGYKRGSQEFGFTNSDPDMIRFYVDWLKSVFKIKKSDLILRVSINNLHSLRVAEVEKFWSEQTQVPLNQFTKTSLIKTNSKKVYKNHEKHMGTLRIKVRKGTAMRREVIGAIRSIGV